MTNAAIIISNMEILITEGTIKPENEINTWYGWKMKGYRVKRGAEHIAEFPIWVKSKKKKTEEQQEPETSEQQEPEQKKKRDFVLKMAYWFTDEQVEKI